MSPQQPTPPKKELKKAWLLTIILHLLIAVSLISYWYFSQNKKSQPIPTNLQTQTIALEQKLPPLLTQTASATTIMPASTAADTVVQSTPTNPDNIERPLANYINHVNNNPPAQKNLVEQHVNVAPPPVNQALTKRDIAPPPGNQALTKRDIAPSERQKPKQDNDTQEVTQLTEELDENYEQIKKHNQQKIDTNNAKNYGENKPALLSTTSEKPVSQTHSSDYVNIKETTKFTKIDNVDKTGSEPKPMVTTE